MTKKRPKILEGKTVRITTGCGQLYVTLNKTEDGKLFEVRLVMGKVGSCKNTELYLLGIALSVMLQSDMPRERVIKTLKKHWLGSKCDSMYQNEEKKFITCYDSIANLIIVELEKETK